MLPTDVHSRCDRLSDRSFLVDLLSYVSFQPVLHNWCNKGRGMCYPVCGMVHIKEPLLLIDRSSLCGGSGFPFSLSEWSLTICLTPYNRRLKCVECVVKHFSLSLSCYNRYKNVLSRVITDISQCAIILVPKFTLYNHLHNYHNSLINDIFV